MEWESRKIILSGGVGGLKLEIDCVGFLNSETRCLHISWRKSMKEEGSIVGTVNAMRGEGELEAKVNVHRFWWKESLHSGLVLFDSEVKQKIERVKGNNIWSEIRSALWESWEGARVEGDKVHLQNHFDSEELKQFLIQILGDEKKEICK